MKRITLLTKGEHYYIFIYNKENKGEVMRQIGKHASNPDLNLSWYDAAVMSQQIRQKTKSLPTFDEWIKQNKET